MSMTEELAKIAEALVAPGKGILAADESSGTIKKRFDSIGVGSTEDTRRDYREMLFRANDAMKNYVSGVILYDETIRQNAKDGHPGNSPDPAFHLDPNYTFHQKVQRGDVLCPRPSWPEPRNHPLFLAPSGHNTINSCIVDLLKWFKLMVMRVLRV